MNTLKETSPENQAGYSGLYLERSGVDSARLAETLVQPPERPLSETEKGEVRQFEADVLKWQVEPGLTLEDVLKFPMVESTVAPLFFAEGFISGEVELEDVEIPPFSSADEVYRWVASSGLDPKQLAALSKKSTELYKEKIADALTHNKSIDESATEAHSIVIDPEEFARQMRGLRGARAMLREWRKDAPRGADIDDAKVAYSDIFLAKVNAQLGSAIPIVRYLQEQAESTGNDYQMQIASELLPNGLMRAMEHGESKQRLFRRLDFLRNGIGYDQDGKATGVSSEVSTSVAETPKGGKFSLEQMEYMKNRMLTPEEMKQFISNVVRAAGLLSTEDESTWSPNRTHRAADGLIQVVINPGKSTFEFNSTPADYRVPSKPRSLYDVLTVGGYHELEHANQMIADDAVGETTKVAKIKGKRVAGLREAGANVRQRQGEQELFGYSKPYADTYASALQVLEAGGSMGDAIRAFYDSKLRAMPDTDKNKAADEAADRVLRLIRGGINSQAMVYAEESILMQELEEVSPEARQRALAVTGLDLVDQAKLHKFGLLEVPEGAAIDWSSYVLEELAKWMNDDTEAA